ncbi:MAG: ATP-binding protein [Melioribacteraceae bacterium]|nr:ATP-binding protein [Melioribacteraceae bacterium]WKZ70600.1 MAG: ATP-binding protein [Melioribacteraceae bacterium]
MKTILTKAIPSDPDLMPEVEELVLQAAETAGLNEDKYNNIALAVAEAISNSMKHGNKNDKSKMVFITVNADDKKMVVILKDQGEGFDPALIPDPTKPENILKDSGRGVHIMRSLLDDLRFNFTPDGTEIILEINLN